MKVKTKSGFVIEVDEKKAKDWRFAKNLAKWDDESTVIQGTSFCVPFLLGADGEKALMDHVMEKDGSIPSEKILSEFREILEQIGQSVKKSQSSQE